VARLSRLPGCGQLILVWQEASWTKFNDLKGYRDTWSEALLRDRNHPSAVIWTLFNESWGYEYADPIYEHVKKLDPTRLVLDNTGGLALQGPNYPENHQKTDIEDVHCYPGFNRFSKNYWLSLYRVNQNNPLMVTEFGSIPYMFNVGKFRQAWGGKDPWWFDASPVRPLGPSWNHHGIQDRYSQWGFDKIYGNWDKFTEAHDWYYFWGLKDQTQAMRMNPELGGFVAWIWDNGQHGTGAIDNFKQKKIFADELAKIWTQDLVVLEEQRHNYWSGEKLYADLHVSHFSDQPLQDARVTWWLEDSDIRGEVPGVTMPSGEVRLIGNIAFTIPDVTSSVMKKLYARLQTKEGKTLSQNYEPVWIYPARYRHPSDIDFTISGITSPSYKVVPMEQRPRVVVATKTDDKIKTFLKEGGTVILLPANQGAFLSRDSMEFRSPITFFPEGQDEMLKRNGLELGSSILGGHTDSFYARKGLGVFDRILYENPYTWQFYAIWPKTQIFGLKPESHEDILAGEYMNLLNRQCATLAQFRCGKGRLILCTFNLLDATHKGLMVRNDPAAVIILNDLLKYAGGDFQPRTELAVD